MAGLKKEVIKNEAGHFSTLVKVDTLKSLSADLYIFAIPVLCLLLALYSRKKKQHHGLLGKCLLIIGGGMSLLTLFSSGIGMIFGAIHPRFSFLHELIGFFVWFIPGFILALSGWMMTRRPDN